MRVVLWAAFSLMVVACWLLMEYVALAFFGALFRKPLVDYLFDKAQRGKHIVFNVVVILFTVAFSVMVFCEAFTAAAGGFPKDDVDIRMLEKDRDQEHREPVL